MEERKPKDPLGIALLVFSGLVAVGGLAFFVYSLWHGIMGLGESLMPAAIPGSTTLHLERPGTYTIFYETRDEYANFNGYELAVTGPDGKDIALTPPRGTTTYSFGDRTGRSVFNFEVAQPGDYRLEGTSEADQPPAQLAVSDRMDSEIFALVMNALAIAATTGLATIILLVLGILRLRSSRPPQ